MGRRSSSLRSKTPKPDGRRASSATGSKNAVEASNENGVSRAVRAKSPRKKTSKSPPPVPPKPSGGWEEGVVEETISAGEAIIKFETESATFAAVSGQETAVNGKESKGEGKSKTSKDNDIISRMKTDMSQGDNQERGVEDATPQNVTGTAAVNGKLSRTSRTSQGSKTRSVSVSSSRKSAKGSTSGVAESSKEGVEATVSKKSSVVSGGGGEGGLMRPTKSWLNHLGETAGGKVPSTPPTLNGTGTAATQSGGAPDEGTADTLRKNSSQKTNPDSSSSSSVSSSSGDKMSTSSSSSDSSSSGKSKALKEKSAMANNNNKAASNLVNGKEICQNGTVKEGHTATEKKDPAMTINGGKARAKRPVNGKEGGRTTMMIRLHPGRTNKLSAYLESQEKPGSRTWLTEALTEEVEDTLCGLEISFSSVPQDIDIKLLPTTQGDQHLDDVEK